MELTPRDKDKLLLFTAALLAVSPAMLYFSRFARNDILMAAWAMGLLTVVSFNVWAEGTIFHSLFGRSAFEFIELLTNIFMPLGGLMIALFAGWALTQSEVMKELGTNATWFAFWRFLVRFVGPAAVSFVFLRTIPHIEGYLIPTLGALLIVAAFALAQRLRHIPCPHVLLFGRTRRPWVDHGSGFDVGRSGLLR